jgi:hypothetical protein
MRFGYQIDPLILTSAAVSFFLAITGDPWWKLAGADTNKLLTVQISPYDFQTIATGIAPATQFLESLGFLTRVLLILSFVSLTVTGIRSNAWWRELSVYFSLSALSELYLSFLLMYHYTETVFLGSYGIVPPSSGISRLPSVLVGLDMNSYANPLVSAGFTLPFYLGFVSLGLIGASQVVKSLRRGRALSPQKGVAAIFTQE